MFRYFSVKRKAVFLLCLFLVLLLGTQAVASGLPHDCPGEGCELCALLSDLRHRFSAPPSAVTLPLPLLVLSFVSALAAQRAPRSSPVSRFDKLSD